MITISTIKTSDIIRQIILDARKEYNNIIYGSDFTTPDIKSIFQQWENNRHARTHLLLPHEDMSYIDERKAIDEYSKMFDVEMIQFDDKYHPLDAHSEDYNTVIEVKAVRDNIPIPYGFVIPKNKLRAMAFAREAGCVNIDFVYFAVGDSGVCSAILYIPFDTVARLMREDFYSICKWGSFNFSQGNDAGVFIHSDAWKWLDSGNVNIGLEKTSG